MVFSLLVTLVASMGFVFGSWIWGITDPNDLAQVWIWAYGIPVLTLWIVGFCVNPKAYNPFPHPESEAGLMSLFVLVFGVGVPAGCLLMNRTFPFDSYGWFQLATVSLSMIAVTGVVIVGGRLLGSVSRVTDTN